MWLAPLLEFHPCAPCVLGPPPGVPRLQGRVQELRRLLPPPHRHHVRQEQGGQGGGQEASEGADIALTHREGGHCGAAEGQGRTAAGPEVEETLSRSIVLSLG